MSRIEFTSVQADRLNLIVRDFMYSAVNSLLKTRMASAVQEQLDVWWQAWETPHRYEAVVIDNGMCDLTVDFTRENTPEEARQQAEHEKAARESTARAMKEQARLNSIRCPRCGREY